MAAHVEGVLTPAGLGHWRCEIIVTSANTDCSKAILIRACVAEPRGD